MRSQFSHPRRPLSARPSVASAAAIRPATATLSTTIACFGTLALAALIPAVSHADTQIGPPTAMSGSIAVLPGSARSQGMAVAIVSSLDTSGNARMARRALIAADAALRSSPGFTPANIPGRFQPVPRAQTAAAQNATNWHWPLTGLDYQEFGKALKAPRALSVTVSPGEDDNSYSATAELYDTKSGGLVGFGRSTATTPDTAPPAPPAEGAAPAPAAAAPTATPQELALDVAVQRAVFELSRTASFGAIVISRPGAYLTRISAGEKDGVRGGARVEYLVDGAPVAFGTITDVGYGESVATVAPETAFPGIYVNSQVRIVNNPTSERAIPSLSAIDEREFSRFERSFGFATAIVGAVYLAFAA